MATVLDDYRIYYEEPLRLRAGDSLTVLEPETDPQWLGWHWCRDAAGREGWVSETFFRAEGERGTMILDYTGQELAARKGDQVTVRSEDHGWYWCEDASGKLGWIPVTHVQR